MKKTSILTILVLICSIGTISRADTVTYDTTASTGLITPVKEAWGYNNMQLNFYGLSNTVTSPTLASLGYFEITGWLGVDYFSTKTKYSTFSLEVDQSVPSSGSDTFTAEITGSIWFFDQDVWIDFDQSSIQIGSVTYTLAQQSFKLNEKSWCGGGVTGVDAYITTTPELSSFLLLGTGLLCLALVLSRKTKPFLSC